MWQDVTAQLGVAWCPCCVGKWSCYAEWVLWSLQWWHGERGRRKSFGCGPEEKNLVCCGEIWELKSQELRGFCESQSSCRRDFVTGKEQKPLLFSDPTASVPAALARVMISLPTHTLDGPYAPHCMAMLPKGTQCSIVGHVPPLLCGFCWSWPGAGWCRQSHGCRQEPAVFPSAAGAGCLCQGVRR